MKAKKMREEDKERLSRLVKFSLKDLETLAQLVAHEKWLKFKMGQEEEVAHLEKLLEKIKSAFIKDHQ